jgi:hypothetical protein
MLKIMTETPPPIETVVTSVPSAVSRVIEKALARTPAERHQGMAAFREALRAAASAEGIALPAAGRASTTRVLSIAPPPDDDVARAETDAAAVADDTSEGVATMSARLRQERVERMRADAQTQLATKRANDSIEVAIDAPVASSSRRVGLLAATVVTAVLGIGIGAALFGGDEPAATTAPTSVTTATVPPASSPQTHAPPPTTSLAPSTSTPPPTTTSVAGAITPPSTTPATTTVRGPRSGRGPREPGGTSMVSTSMVDTVTTVPPTMETATTRMGGLPSVVGWEDE